jgi:hypothetical protein
VAPWAKRSRPSREWSDFAEVKGDFAWERSDIAEL